MHEHSFVEAILSNIKDKENISGIVIEVGELAGIEPLHLKKHLHEVTNWEIEALEKKSYIECFCGYKGRAKILQRLHDLVIFECPNCGKIPEVLEGKNIKIISVTYK